MNFWSYNNRQIAYDFIEKDKNFPTIIFLHDSLGCIRLWRDFPLILGDKLNCNVLVYDRIGYGQSDDFVSTDRGSDYMEIEADILAQLINELSFNSVFLFGHSDGASIATIAAGKYPNLINGIILEGVHTLVEEITLDGIRDAVKMYEKTDLSQKLQKYHEKKAKNVFDAWTKTWLKPEFKNWDINHFVNQIECPILIFQGEKDEFGSMDQMKGFEQKEDCVIHLLHECGHNPHKEQKELVIQFCEAFFRMFQLNL